MFIKLLLSIIQWMKQAFLYKLLIKLFTEIYWSAHSKKDKIDKTNW